MKTVPVAMLALALAACGGTPAKPKGPAPEYETYDAGAPIMEHAPATPPTAPAPPPPTD